MAPARTTLHLTGGVDEIGRLYPWLEAACGAAAVPAKLRFGMHLAVEEVVANAAMYGFPPGQPGDIRVSFDTAGDEVILLVEDSGQPFDPLARPLVDPAERILQDQPGGLGLVLLHHYCHGLHYEFREGHNRLTMRFRTAQD